MLEKLWHWLYGNFAPHCNARGLALIQASEGLRLFRYKDTNGAYKIGYGSPADGYPSMITAADASLLLLKTLRPIEKAIHRAVKVPLTSDQFSALCSFAYNVGIENLLKSTLLKELNKGDYAAAAEWFCSWDHVNGRISLGITERRWKERCLFLSQKP